jgi:Lrp/AsnC family leucine-responsive transcriptional regulator
VGLQAIICLKTTHQHIKSCIQQFAQMPEVLEADRVTGENCCVIRCAIPKPEQLERIVDQLAIYGTVTATLVLSKTINKPVCQEILGASSQERV